MSPQKSESTTQPKKFDQNLLKDLIEKKLPNSVNLNDDYEINFAKISVQALYLDLIRSMEVPEEWEAEFQKKDEAEMYSSENEAFCVFSRDLRSKIIHLEVCTLAVLNDVFQMCTSFDQLCNKINESYRSIELIKKGHELQNYLCTKQL